MRRVALYGTLAAALVTGGNLLHGLSHAGGGVPLAAWQQAYVLLVIFLAPSAAALLLWGRFRRAGAWLLVVSMAGALGFGLAYHFLIPGPDNALTLQPGAWRPVFRASAALLVIMDALGLAAGLRALDRLSRAPSETGSASGIAQTEVR